MPTSGYSGTPLAKKLGIKPGFKLLLVNAPQNYFSLFTDWPDSVIISGAGDNSVDLIHFFTSEENEFLRMLPELKNRIKPNGIIWASWPKKASKMVTDLTENTIRNYAIKIGLVDIKVCAVDKTWSGLKLVIPVKDR